MSESEEIERLLPLDLNSIPGWLAPMAAFYTLELVEQQRKHGVSGNMLEIGVFKGKYLALMYKASAPDGSKVTGIDAFIGSTNTTKNINEVKHNVARACGDADRLTVLVHDSTKISMEQLQEQTTSDLSFISIDGGHTYDVVLKDLENCFPILKNGGIISLDDFFNHGTPEVTEAFFAYYSKDKEQNIVPFAHCYNKLFLTTRSHHARYLAHTYHFLERHQTLPPCHRTLARINANKEDGYTVRFFGWEIVSFF